MDRVMDWIKRIYSPSGFTIIDLKGAAEMANGIEKYGRFGYSYRLMMDVRVANPRMNCVITGIGDV